MLEVSCSCLMAKNSEATPEMKEFSHGSIKVEAARGGAWPHALWEPSGSGVQALKMVKSDF